MSAIASFSLFNKKDLNEFVKVLGERFEATSRAAVLKHPLNKFRSTKTTELVRYQWSGYVFAFELPLFLKTLGIELSDFAAATATTKLSTAMEQPVHVFSTPDTKKLTAALDEVLGEPALVDQIEKFLKKYPKKQMRTDPKLSAAPVFDAILILRHWVGRVTTSQFGLLEVAV